MGEMGMRLVQMNWMSLRCALFFLWIVLPTSMLAQEVGWTVSSDVSRTMESVGFAVTRPMSWGPEDALVAGGLVVVSGSSFLLDHEVREVMMKNRSSLANGLERIGYNYGAPQIAGSAALVLYTVGAMSDNQWLRETGMMLTGAAITAGVIQVPSRILGGRARPSTGWGNDSFRFLKGFGQDRSSFFSGHAAIAFSFSTILARQINNDAATVGLYMLALTTPLARLYKDRHWLSDCVIGSALGVFIGNTIVGFHRQPDHQSSLRLRFGVNRKGLVCQLVF
jgi:hypothetical protein